MLYCAGGHAREEVVDEKKESAKKPLTVALSPASLAGDFLQHDQGLFFFCKGFLVLELQQFSFR